MFRRGSANAACVLVAWLAGTAAAETSVCLRAVATIDRPSARLGDIAAIRDADAAQAARLAAIEIGSMPASGGKTSFDLPTIKERIRQAGVSPVSLEFSGAYAVTVTRNPERSREAATTDVDAHRPASVSGAFANSPPPGDSARQGSTVAERHGVDEDGPCDWGPVIAGMLRPHVAAALGISGESLEVEVDAARATEFLNQHRPATWDLVAPQTWQLGGQQVMVEAKTSAQTARIPLRVTVAAARATVVARRRIAQGETIAPADVQLVQHVSQSDDPTQFRSVTEVVGKQAERPIAADRPVTRRDVRNPPVVFRNSPVTVHVRHRTAYFTLQATARDDGGVGDLITVVNPTSRQPLEVRVVGFQTAELITEGLAGRGPIDADRRSAEPSIAGNLSGGEP